MICFHSDYLHVEYYAAHGVLVSQWFNKCTSEQYKTALNQLLHQVHQLGAQYLISDRRLLPPISTEDIRWTLGPFLNEFSRLPLKRCAIINSFDVAADKYLELFLHNPATPIPFETRKFEDLTSAYDWLVSAKAA